MCVLGTDSLFREEFANVVLFVKRQPNVLSCKRISSNYSLCKDRGAGQILFRKIILPLEEIQKW